MAGRTAPTAALRIESVSAARRVLPMRMPFQFGDVTLRAVDAVYLRALVWIRTPGSAPRTVEGISSSILSPAWFDKSAASYPTKAERLRVSIALAADRAHAAEAPSAHDLHRALQPAVTAACAKQGIPALTSSFGVALLDGAVVDALCRATGSTLHQGLRDDLFGFGNIPGLPARPLDQFEVRHTVGRTDPLTSEDQTARLDDGLPETLEEVIETYGVRWFKVKIDADIDGNLDRLRRIQDVLQRRAAADCQLVFDGNEQFDSMDAFVTFVRALRRDDALAPLRRRTRWFEQPVARDHAFAPGVRAALADLGGEQPVIADESDGTDDAVTEALALGYGGVSAKNCKGIFRTLHSARVLAAHRAAGRGPGILTGEDLTHPGVRALTQDNAVVCALGIPHAERNGHHYVRGLAGLPPAEQAQAARSFGDLFQPTDSGLLRAAIRSGRMRSDSCNRLAYGGPIEVDWETLEPIDLGHTDPD